MDMRAECAQMLGVGTATVNSTTAATTLYNGTVTNFISISAAASVGIMTAQNCYIEQMQPN